MKAGGRFTTAATNGIVCAAMNELRDLRRAIGLGQREFAALLSIPLETYRPWDSGRRVVSAAVLQRAREAVAHHQRQHELLPLDQLARELHVHLRTLQAAARTGRLDAHFSVRSVFGRPIRSASRAAGEQFMATHYRRFSGQEICPAPLPTVPNDYDRPPAGSPSSAPTHARRPGPTHRRRWQGRHLSVGVTKAHAVAGVLAEDSGTRMTAADTVIFRVAR